MNFIKRHTKAEPAEEHQGRHRRARGAAARVERAAGLPGVRGADARRPPAARRRHARARSAASAREWSTNEPPEGSLPTEDVLPALRKEFGYTNVMAVPRITKVVVNMGLGEGTQNAKIVDTGAEELGKITGQKAAVTRATKSIAQFKVRRACPSAPWSRCAASGCTSSSTGSIAIALPRVRDFRGVSADGLRRPRQLHARPARPADVPGDRLPEGRQGAAA